VILDMMSFVSMQKPSTKELSWMQNIAYTQKVLEAEC
jgi:hypothetical protein